MFQYVQTWSKWGSGQVQGGQQGRHLDSSEPHVGWHTLDLEPNHTATLIESCTQNVILYNFIFVVKLSTEYLFFNKDQAVTEIELASY